MHPRSAVRQALADCVPRPDAFQFVTAGADLRGGAVWGSEDWLFHVPEGNFNLVFSHLEWLERDDVTWAQALSWNINISVYCEQAHKCILLQKEC